MEESESKPTKLNILFCGDVMGNFRTLFTRIEELNKDKGPFDTLYCVGNFFGSDNDEYEDLKSGKIEVPIETYIINGNEKSFKELYEPLEKAVPKIVYLGKMGSLIATSGLKVAYLSGVDLPENLHNDKTALEETFNKYNTYISKDLVKSMINTVGSGVDILLTSQWPKDVTKHGVSLDEDSEAKVKDAASLSIAYVAKCLRPRYHIAGLAGLFYDRVPYRNYTNLLHCPLDVTRFVGLAPVKKVKTSKKEKWLYALGIFPLCSPHILKYTGPVTACPYSDLVYDNVANDVGTNFFFGASANTQKRPSITTEWETNPEKRRAIIQKMCWFCLSNKNVEKQLIVAIGDHCYITIAKGVIVPEHALIVPINHIATSVELSTEAFEEAEKFKEALANYFHDKDKDVVFFERSYHTSHLQIQVVPTPKQMRNEFKGKLHARTLKAFEITCLPTSSTIKMLPPKKSGDYYFFEVMADKKPDAKYLAFLDKSADRNFPIQMGRHILADALGCLKEKANWQKCCDDDEEAEMAETMREGFKKYDFTQK